MANRWMQQFWLSFIKGKASLFGQVAIGATGAPTLSAANSMGITSITRNSAGNYTIVLNDTWVKFLGFHWTMVDSGTQTVATCYVVSETVATAATKNIVIQCQDFAGAAVDPRNGATLRFEIVLNNSSAM